MNNETIETLLRKAPAPRPPKELLGQLTADLQRRSCPPTHAAFAWWSWLKPWLPVTACLVLGMIVMGAQLATLSELKQQNDALRQSLGDFDALRKENAEYRRLSALAAEIERLDQALAEIATLKSEIARFKTTLSEMAKLQFENDKIIAELKLPPDVNTEMVVDARAKAQRITCVNHLKNLGLAARIWASDHDDVLPPDVLAIQNQLSSPKLLVCPSDDTRSAAANWQQFTLANCSYEFLASNAKSIDAKRVLSRCAIHNNVGLVDGSVHQLPLDRVLVEKDGKLYMSEP
ncbi:MAG: hypothetical protein AB1813_18015 [Verrucomicrobiota bacterium]